MKSVLTIDEDAIAWNYNFLRRRAGSAEVGAAVKADAYGLGAIKIVEVLRDIGCSTFFTAHYSEAVELREVFDDISIVVLHGIRARDYREALAYNIIPTINHLNDMKSMGDFARSAGKEFPAFVHIDTGMNRLGLSPSEQRLLAEDLSLLKGIKVKAWMSHFACADDFDSLMTARQRDRFVEAVRPLPAAPASICNSSGIFWGEDYLFDLLRPGIALYGGNPTPGVDNPMKPVVELCAPIIQIRDVASSMTVGYGAAHKVERHKGRIATVAIGYADGYSRYLGEKGVVMIGGFSAPVVGRVSMDLLTVDVSDVPESKAHIGAMATLIGEHRTIDQIAAECGTIPYEILTGLGGRIVKEYVGGESRAASYMDAVG